MWVSINDLSKKDQLIWWWEYIHLNKSLDETDPNQFKKEYQTLRLFDTRIK